MINCFIIFDENNEVSKWYLERSLESFAKVSDILTITPVQCTTPETLPIRFQENQPPIPFYVADDGKDYLKARYYGGTFCDDPVYNSIMYSHMQLIKRIADGERLIIMEHDAALVDEDSLRYMIEEYLEEVDVFMPGACMEFYSLSQRYAKELFAFADNFPYSYDRVSGPLGAMIHMEYLYPREADQLVLVPAKEEMSVDKICLSNNLHNAIVGDGFDMIPPACKQFLKKEVGTTNAHLHDVFFNENSYTNIDPATGVLRRDFVFLD